MYVPSSSLRNFGSIFAGLFDFYSQHNPAKATEEHVDSTLQKYSGREDVLVSKLRARYNVAHCLTSS